VSLEGPTRGTRRHKRNVELLSAFRSSVTATYRVGPERDSRAGAIGDKGSPTFSIFWEDNIMSILAAGEKFPQAKLKDTDGKTVEFPAVFAQAPATVVFFYRGRW